MNKYKPGQRVVFVGKNINHSALLCATGKSAKIIRETIYNEYEIELMEDISSSWHKGKI